MAPAAAQPGHFRLIVAKRTLAEVRAASVEVGTHSGCGFVLNDPLVAARHARIVHAEGAFWIEDIGSATGTYVDGLPADGRRELRDGSRVVLGVSRVAIAIASEPTGPVLVASVEEGRFHFKAKDPEAFLSDPDAWVRSEVRFGRVPLVASLSWGALLASVLFFAWALATEAGERALAPGPFGGVHAAVFAVADPGPHAGENLRRAHAQAAGKGCASCHTTEGAHALGVQSCAVCHGDLLRSAHPFRDAPGASAVGRLEADACSLCHTEHAGGDSAAVQAAARALSAATACTECHEAVPTKVSRKMEPPALSDHAFGYDPFSHAAHVGGRKPIACATCHQRSDADASGFAPVAFETCQGCHADRTPDAAIADVLRKKQLVWKPAWHGTDGARPGEGCLECHARLHDGALRRETIEREADVVFRWKERGHEGQFDAARCKECHSDAPRLAADAAPRESPFLHALHVAQLAPTGPARAAESQRCAACHAAVAASPALTEARPLPDLAACRACHSDAAGAATLLSADERGAERARERPLFPHGKHQAVEGGCFACHAFEGGDDALDARPITTPEALACLPCHAGHRNVGGGTCQGCHPPDSAATKAVFAGRPLVRSDWPSRSFPHYLGPGHQGLMEKPGGCASCHDEDDMGRARTITDVKIEPRVYEQCRVCHAQRGDPFHWH